MRLGQFDVGGDSRMWLSPDAEKFIESGGLNLNRGPELVGVYCKAPAYANPKEIRSEIEKRLSEKIEQNYNSQLVRVYIDKAPGGRRVKGRKYYEEMIQDCMDGKLTYLIVPSVGIFSRCIFNAHSTVRMLRRLPRPVFVYFSKERINTFNERDIMQFEFLAAFANDKETS